MRNKKTQIAVLALAVVLLLSFNAVSQFISAQKAAQEAAAAEASAPEETQAPLTPHMIPNAEKAVIVQDDLQAGCETCSCTTLFHLLVFDLDEHTFADHYLDCHPITVDEAGNWSGPDLYSGFAGTAYYGWGVYAPSMAKSMNRYLSDQNSSLKAYNYENIPLETLCRDYFSKDNPVMIWATVDMQAPGAVNTWTVDYVDENARTRIGETFRWYLVEHCLLLIGYDDGEYYFDDSSVGEVTHYPKSLVEQRYEQIGSQCIVVK